MERLKLKYKLANKALKTLEEAMGEFQKSKVTERLRKIIRDSVIKRFEYSVDIVWKYLKEYLQEKKGIERKSPKDVFKECFRIGLILEEETKKSLDMVDVRNLTTHTYDEETAEEFCKLIPDFLDLMKKIVQKIEV